MISIVEWIESPFIRSKLIAELENNKENYQSWSLPVPYGVSGNLLLTGYYKYYQLMLEPIRIDSGLLKLLKKATHQCVDNLSPSDASTDIDIDQAALVAILVLLRYHPQKEVGQFYFDKVNRIMQWKEKYVSG